MVMTNFEKVKTFMESFGQEVKDKPKLPDEEIVDLRLNLINEEFDTYRPPNLKEILFTEGE